MLMLLIYLASEAITDVLASILNPDLLHMYLASEAFDFAGKSEEGKNEKFKVATRLANGEINVGEATTLLMSWHRQKKLSSKLTLVHRV